MDPDSLDEEAWIHAAKGTFELQERGEHVKNIGTWQNSAHPLPRIMNNAGQLPRS